MSEFSLELWGLEGWNFVQTWTVGGCTCIVYTEISLLLLIHHLVLHFSFFPIFKQFKKFVTLFSGIVSPRKLKVGTHVKNGWMYRVYRKQAAAAYSSRFFICLSLQMWTMGGCIVYTANKLLLLIHPFFFFIFLSNFQRLKFFVTLFSETVRPSYSKLVTHVDCEWMYRVYCNQAAAAANSSLYFFIFLSLQYSNNFKTFLSRTARHKKLKQSKHE